MRRIGAITASGNRSDVEDPAGAREAEGVDEDALVRAARKGDENAFAALLRRHEPRVLRVLGLLGIPAAEREDVAQEVFVRVFRYLDGFRIGRPFSGWVYRITVNVAHDHRTREHRRRTEETEWTEVVESTVEDGGSGSHDERLELRERLQRALERLSDRERAVFVLREMEGLATREIARALGVTGVTVRRHLGRARRALQRNLAGHEKKNEPR